MVNSNGRNQHPFFEFSYSTNLDIYRAVTGTGIEEVDLDFDELVRWALEIIDEQLEDKRFR
ncbi:hypothetical protein [Neobacillus drentensis]|uniref:hypothetical protein n=1 Tax=Neobacillus drentensis TaxID=220684 RepID=UPI002866814E|nr:hypothetical protein [Neobacillus drentensis]MDR7239161.1 hypothetical protein [Neobacillus drentensis]